MSTPMEKEYVECFLITHVFGAFDDANPIPSVQLGDC